MFSDILHLSQQELKRAQHEAILNELPADPAAIRDTQSTLYRNGLYQLDQLIARSVLDNQLLDTCRRLAASDAAFSYVNHLPKAAFLAAYRAQSLEESLYGRATDAVAQLAILLSAFTNLLDGIVDESPDILPPAQLQALEQVLTAANWETRAYTRILEFPDAHPIVRLLFAVTRHIIDSLVESPGWQQDPMLQAEFKKASKAAVMAELYSAQYQDLFVLPSDLAAAQHHLAAKSFHWARVIALAPICLNGWPPSLSADDFSAFAFALGRFGGWLDDLSDLSEDFHSRKWSNVSLTVYQLTTELMIPADQFPASLPILLSDAGIRQKIIGHGVRQFQEVTAALSRLPLINDAVINSIGFIVHCFLSDTAIPVPNSSEYELA